jgi:tRNA1(Val) A37 N6-methylase TrmN6
MVAKLGRPREIVALEIQPHLVNLIERSAEMNRIENLRAIEGDLRVRKIKSVESGTFDLAIANPPYLARNTGRVSPNRGRRLARSEESATMDEFVAAAARFLINGGRGSFIFAADRVAELIASMRSRRLEPKRIRFVHPAIAARAVSVLIEARKGGGVEAHVEPPLILYDSPGVYSDEARRLLGI